MKILAIMSLAWIPFLGMAENALSLTRGEKSNIVKELGDYEEGVDLHFIDLDGDGREEVVAALRQVDSRSGCQWLVYGVENDSTLKVISDSRNSEFFFHIRGVYLAELANGRELLVCRDFDRGKDRYNLFYLNREGRIVRLLLKNDIDDILRNPEFVSLKRAMKKDKGLIEREGLSTDECTQIRLHYASELRKDGVVLSDEDIMIMDLGENNDGVRAVYVSSSRERRPKERFCWHLYLVRGKEYVRLKEDEVYFFETKFAKEALAGMCEASRFAFYEIVTERGGVIPIVAEFAGKRLLSKAFPLVVSAEDLEERTKTLDEEEWSFWFEEKTKTKPPRELRQYANDLFFDSILEVKRASSKTVPVR